MLPDQRSGLPVGIVQPFDIADGYDLRDPRAVFDATQSCDAVVHAGALAHDT